MRFQHIFFLAFICCTPAVLLAQGGPTDKVDIIKNYQAQLLDADKLKVTPTLPALDTATKFQDYIVPPRQAKVSYEAPKLKPLGMKAGAKDKVYHGFVKAGGGIPTSLYGEAGYGFTVKKKFDGKLWARHHQANFKDIENQRFSNTDVLLSGIGNIYKNNALEAKAGYSYDRVHYYGYDRDTFSFDPERVRQNFQTLDLSAKFFNGERNDNDLNYFVSPKFYHLKDNYANSETGFDLGFGASKWFAEKHLLRVGLRTDFTSFRDTVREQLNNIYIQPSFTFHADFLRLKIGGNFASNRDIFHVFPDAELNIRVAGDAVQLFAVASGDLRKNTFRSMTEYNPFLEIRAPGTNLRNTIYRNYYGGLRGNVSWINYSIQGGWAKASDLALFQTYFVTLDNQELTRFQVLYDTAQIVNFQGTVKMTPTKDLTVTAVLSQNFFTMSNAQEAWGLPGLEGNFTGEYRFMEGKAGFKAECYIADQIHRRDSEGVPGKDGALFDLSLGGNYRFSKNFGAFLDINNVLNNKRQRWHNYPMYGLNVLVGLTARF